MEETIGKAGLRDAAIGTGIAVDKMLALTGQTPAFQIANIVMPNEAEREERRAMHDRLDAIARRLMESGEPKPWPLRHAPVSFLSLKGTILSRSFSTVWKLFAAKLRNSA